MSNRSLIVWAVLLSLPAQYIFLLVPFLTVYSPCFLSQSTRNCYCSDELCIDGFLQEKRKSNRLSDRKLLAELRRVVNSAGEYSMLSIVNNFNAAG